ncbi:hypothetical protein E2C01_001963 [Portunus trituberculatus]|uniref:Secreted protein n=1 Tax=Portunus trituberculatus TaxID=210409 RepID=A0A5B7CJA5_PORTR|nr:hypothetical protein [Portunus trituberculatus]
MGGSSEGLPSLVLLVLGQHLADAGDSCNNPGYRQHLTVASVWSLSPRWLLLGVNLPCTLRAQMLHTLRQVGTAVVAEFAVVVEFAVDAVVVAVDVVDAGVVVAVLEQGRLMLVQWNAGLEDKPSHQRQLDKMLQAVEDSIGYQVHHKGFCMGNQSHVGQERELEREQRVGRLRLHLNSL